ncbi:MAG: VacJ family lipoprotein [Campylobacterota bacterium]|nr:VacJ family lipoprotein [Campylobacterota bacterium]
MKKILLLFVTVVTLIASDDFDAEFADEFEEELTPKKEIFDPLSGYNRWMTDVNDFLFIEAIEPAAREYNFILPEGVRKSIYNFFENISYPASLANNLLQFKLEHSMNESIRFVANSTLGVLGLFDVADAWFEIKAHKEDFGQTLGFYGVGSGFPVVLPFFGQRNLRDLVGNYVDTYADPTYHVSLLIKNDVVSFGTYTLIKGYKDFNEYSLNAGSYSDFTKGAIDLYPLIRDAYEQRRDNLIEE